MLFFRRLEEGAANQSATAKRLPLKTFGRYLVRGPAAWRVDRFAVAQEINRFAVAFGTDGGTIRNANMEPSACKAKLSRDARVVTSPECRLGKGRYEYQPGNACFELRPGKARS